MGEVDCNFVSLASTLSGCSGIGGNNVVQVTIFRQGDHISPQIFAIAMHALISLMQGCSLLNCLYIYANDIILFIRPSRIDHNFARKVMNII